MGFLEFDQSLRLVHGVILLTGLYAGLGYVWWLRRHTHNAAPVAHRATPAGRVAP